ncbi:hypothetical protein JXX16_17830, partial [Ruthenibacterium lactatiformans]|uniref:hypothetical protein n=1 Tax=Ruthenibacterium lactatiformans TaxID=1550024 RepID=UPI0019678C89
SLVDIFHYPFPLYRLFFCPANRVWGRLLHVTLSQNKFTSDGGVKMKYNHAMAERGYKREWKAAKLEMRKAGVQRKQIREAARAYRLEFNGERRFYRRTDVVPACEREDRPPKGVDTLFQESHSMHSPDLEDDIGGLIDQVERSDLLSWLRSLTEQQYRVVELYTEGYAMPPYPICRTEKQSV